VIIFVGIPVLDGKPHVATVDSLLAEQVFALGKGVHLLVEWEVGCSLIGHARNRLARRFLATTECRAMVFVDADISWPTGSLVALARSRKDVIGGTYRAKHPESQFHVLGRPEKDGRLFKVNGLPGGFLKISRRAFERTKAKAYLSANGSAERDYFPMGFHRGTYFGEDFGFCRLHRQSGGTVWLDPDIHLRHHDGMSVYSGDPREWLRQEHGA
jgi:hypothetical protein